MLISRSLGRKVIATATVAVGFVLMYEATVMDFRDIPRLAFESHPAQKPAPGPGSMFEATAYCKGTTTASGVNVRTGSRPRTRTSCRSDR